MYRISSDSPRSFISPKIFHRMIFLDTKISKTTRGKINPDHSCHSIHPCRLGVGTVLNMATHEVSILIDNNTSYVIESGGKLHVKEVLSKICKLQNILHRNLLLSEADLCLIKERGPDTVVYMVDAYIDLDKERSRSFKVVGVSHHEHMCTQKMKKYRQLIDMFTLELENTLPARSILQLSNYIVDNVLLCSSHCDTSRDLLIPMSVGSTYEELAKLNTTYAANVKATLTNLLDIATSEREILHLRAAAGEL